MQLAPRLSLLILFFLPVQLIYPQEKGNLLDSIIISHKELRLESLKKKISNLNSTKLEILLRHDLDYLLEGKIAITSKINLDSLNGRKKYIGKYILGDLLKREGAVEDSVFINMYLGALRASEADRDTLVVNEILNRMNTQLFLNGNDLDTYQKYVEKYRRYRKDSIDHFYVCFHEIGFEMMKYENSPTIDSKWIERKFKEISNYSENHYLKGLMHNLHSIYFSAYLQNQDMAKKYSDLAIQEFSKDTTYIAKQAINAIEFNNAIILYEKRKFANAIPIFKNALKEERNLVYRMYGYDWLHKCYDSLGDYGNAYLFFKKMGTVKDSLDLLQHAREIKAIEAKYDFAEKEKKLARLADEKKNAESNFKTLLPFFGLTVVLTFISLYFFRRYRVRSEKLELEQEAVMKRINQLREAVVKKHIVLRNKTKFLVTEIMYIKSDGHYLKLFLANGKEHMSRGKLKKILAQLPPNFIQCHRSYIVNSNYVKQYNGSAMILIDKSIVPISRSFKNNF